MESSAGTSGRRYSRPTARELEKVRAMVNRGDLRGAGGIGVQVGRVVNKHKVAKHFELTIENDSFEFALRDQVIAHPLARTPATG